MSKIKEDLIQIAMQTVQKSGIHALTIRELGEAVGIKSSSVMYHFKSKDGLIQELINSYSQSLIKYLEELNNTDLNSKDKLLKFVDIFETTLKDNKFCLAGMLASQNDNLDLITKEKTKEFFTYAENWIYETLINKETLKSDMDLKLTAKVIISSLEGAMMLDKLDESSQRLNAIKEWIKSF